MLLHRPFLGIPVVQSKQKHSINKLLNPPAKAITFTSCSLCLPSEISVQEIYVAMRIKADLNNSLYQITAVCLSKSRSLSSQILRLDNRWISQLIRKAKGKVSIRKIFQYSSLEICTILTLRCFLLINISWGIPFFYHWNLPQHVNISFLNKEQDKSRIYESM